MLSAIMLSVVILYVNMLTVIILSVVAAYQHNYSFPQKVSP